MELAVGEKTAQNIPFMGTLLPRGWGDINKKGKYREEWRGMELPEKGRSGPNPTVRL